MMFSIKLWPFYGQFGHKYYRAMHAFEVEFYIIFSTLERFYGGITVLIMKYQQTCQTTR